MMLIKTRLFLKYITLVLALVNPCVSLLVAMDCNVIATGRTVIGNGKISGKACIVESLNQFNKINVGDIVVASTTNQSWDEVLKKAAGIIIEDGDQTSHAAQFGKQLNIPVLMGVPQATKKIKDGSSIGFDCETRNIYTMTDIFNGVYVKPPKNRLGIIKKPTLLFNINNYDDFSGYVSQSNPKSSQLKDKKLKDKKTITQNESSAKGIKVTSERLQQDIPAIQEYLEYTKKEIWVAKRVGKWAAMWRISSEAYDSIPFEFFAKEEVIKQAFRSLANGADYIQETKEKFKKEILKDSLEIDDSKIAEFLYKNTVNNIGVSAELQKELIEKPVKLDEKVQNNTVNRFDYVYYTLLNFVTRYYLEQELKEKKKH